MKDWTVCQIEMHEIYVHEKFCLGLRNDGRPEQNMAGHEPL